MSFPLPPNEEQRLAALRRYRILDTDPEQGFDDLAQLAAYICKTPIALISLLDEERQWFKARVGLNINETARSMAFCSHAIMDADTFIVPDALQDQRFADNPLVRGQPHIRFYAGAPICTPEGDALGTLCVIDRQPRELTPEQRNALEALRRQVQAQLELRRNLEELSAALAARETAEQEREKLIRELRDTLADLRAVRSLLPICPGCKTVRNDPEYRRHILEYVGQCEKIDYLGNLCPSCQQHHASDLHWNVFREEG
jgi:GAF domain-containing protein